MNWFKLAGVILVTTGCVATLGCGDDDTTATSTTTGSGGMAATTGSGGTGAAGGTTGVGGTGGAGGNGGAGAALPLDGLGSINGMCDELDPEELVAGSPALLISNELDFGTAPFDEALLSVGGKKLFDEPNLGGSSKFSEIFAYEMLYRCELAGLLKSEAEINYDVDGKKTDMLVTIDDAKIGVSVVRAYKPGGVYTAADAEAILTSKLSDILESSDNVSPGDSWSKQILHVIAYEPLHRDAIVDALPTIDPAVRADTIVIVSLTSGEDEFIYTE